MIRRLDECLVLVLDTESTGLNTSTDRIVELGGAYFHRGNLVAKVNTLINPGIPIPAEASAVHGIGDAEVADAPTFAAMAPRLVEHLTGRFAAERLGVNEAPVIAGYNLLHYDLPLLVAELQRAGAPVPADLAEGRAVDPLLWLRWHERDLRASLSMVCVRRGIPLENAHAAWADAKATGHLLMQLLAPAGPIPTDLEAAMSRQGELGRVLAEEERVWGRHLYPDREDPTVIRFGQGASIGMDTRAAAKQPGRNLVRFYLNKIADLTPAARAHLEGLL